MGDGVNPSSDESPHGARASIRMDARLDAATRAKVDALARRFRRPRAAVVCHVMEWGLRQGRAETLDQGESEGPVRHLYLSVEVALHQRVQQAAAALGMDMGPWLRHVVRRVSVTDFPGSWQEERSEERSHESRTYQKRFMLRLDALTGEKLESLSTHFDRPAAEIIRQLVAQANIDAFPKSWHMRAAERRGKQARRDEPGKTEEPKP
jgi:predicted DNA-binding protein